MSKTITIAPVQKRIRVAATQAHAFAVFTGGISNWWPRRANIGASPIRTVTIEPREGGLWFTEGEDGTRTTTGRIRLWDPPHRFIVSWDIDHRWQPDASVASEVEVVFVADGPDTTIVELEHRNFEILGEQGGASMRRDVDGGWPGILEDFRKAVEGAGQ